MSADPLQATTLASQAIANAALGPPLVGWMLQLFFAGFAACLLAAYIPTTQFKADPRRLKALLLVTSLLVLIQSMISFYSIYHYATWQQRTEDDLFGQTVVDCFATLPVGIIGALTQAFLAARASTLFERKMWRLVYQGAVAVIIVGGLLGTWFYVALSFHLRLTGEANLGGLNFSVAIGLWLWCCAAVDFIVTASLCLLLYRKIRGFSHRTDKMLRQLILISLESASYTATFALLGAAMAFSFSPDSQYSNSAGAFYQPLSSFYLISMTSTLSARAKIRATTDLPRHQASNRPAFPFIHASDAIHTMQSHVSQAGAEVRRPRAVSETSGYLSPIETRSAHPIRLAVTKASSSPEGEQEKDFD